MQLSRLREVLGSYPLVINTVPALLLDRDMLRIVRKDALILDLASKPGGDDVQDHTGSASPVGTEGCGAMPEKQERFIAAGLAALLVTVLVTVLMQKPSQPVVVSVQTKTPPVAEIGTVPSAAATEKQPVAAPSVTASRSDQSKDEVLQRTTPDYNLNTADEAALQEVSGVGAFLAAEIIAYRDSAGGFTRRSQLLEIPGIGETLAARIMERFYIPDEQPDPAPEVPQDAEPQKTEPAPAEAQEQEQGQIMLDLNAAERDDLLQLPGMTGELADAILSLREQLGGYQDIHELLFAEGLSPEYFEHTLREHLYIVNSE